MTTSWWFMFISVSLLIRGVAIIVMLVVYVLIFVIYSVVVTYTIPANSMISTVINVIATYCLVIIVFVIFIKRLVDVFDWFMLLDSTYKLVIALIV